MSSGARSWHPQPLLPIPVPHQPPTHHFVFTSGRGAGGGDGEETNAFISLGRCSEWSGIQGSFPEVPLGRGGRPLQRMDSRRAKLELVYCREKWGVARREWFNTFLIFEGEFGKGEISGSIVS